MMKMAINHLTNHKLLNWVRRDRLALVLFVSIGSIGYSVALQGIRVPVAESEPMKAELVAVAQHGVPDSKWNSNYFKERFPPLQGLIPLLIGVFAQTWGWFNLRRSRYLPNSGIIFLFGICLLAYGLYRVLPWWADTNF